MRISDWSSDVCSSDLRGVCTPLQFPSGMSLIDGKDRTMQNIAEFRIIGRVGKISEHDKVTKVNVAANYNRQENGEWVTDTHWNEVTLFGKLIEDGGKAQRSAEHTSELQSLIPHS